jgi:DNA-binding MarR family transcriptional regulator
VDRMVPTLSVLNAWKQKFDGFDTRLSPEHMELFGFLALMNNLEGLELQHVQKKLGYFQAKLHRTADALKKLGLIDLLDSPLDGRQKQVRLTKQGMKFADRIADLEQGNSGDHWLSIAASIASDVHSSQTHRSIRKEAIAPDSKPMVPKDMLTEALSKRGEVEIEVGKNYVKTLRGTVTFPALLKKTNLTSMLDFIVAVDAGEFDLDEVLQPAVRHRDLSDDPLGELTGIYSKYGTAAIEENPELRNRVHLLSAQIARNNKVGITDFKIKRGTKKVVSKGLMERVVATTKRGRASSKDVSVKVYGVKAKGSVSVKAKVYSFKAPEGVTEKWWDLYEAADDAGKETLVNASFSNSREYRHMAKVVKMGKWATLIKRSKARGKFQITSEEPEVLEALEALEAEQTATKGK